MTWLEMQEAKLQETAAFPGLISKAWWSEQSSGVREVCSRGEEQSEPTSDLRVWMLHVLPANPGRISVQERGSTDDWRRIF